jgi:acyl transferase domain-containing protein
MSRTSQENILVLLSGEDRPALLDVIERLLSLLKKDSDIPLEELTILSGRAERLAIVSPRAELADRLKTARDRLVGLRRTRLFIRDRSIFFGAGDTAGRVAFLFPGQGSQHTGMLGELYEKLPPVRAWFQALDEAHLRAGDLPPSHLIYPPRGSSEDERRELEHALFDIGRGAQLGTVANLALYEALGRLGIEADFVVGHSNGEHAAVLAACAERGALRDEVCNWLRRASRAGLKLGEPPLPEKMVAVSAVERERLEPLVARYPGELFLAMDNCPHQQVLAGRRATVDLAAKEIAAGGGVCGNLPFTRAYHTPLFFEWAQTLRACYEELPLQAARIPIFSCLTGSAIPPEPAVIRDNMAGQWTSPVRFRETIEALYAAGVRTFVEVGPGSKLTAFVEDTLRGRHYLATSTSSTQRGDLLQLQHLLAALHAHGIIVDPRRFELLTSPLSPAATPQIIGEPKPARPDVAIVELAAATASHTALIAEARASLSRMENIFRAVTQTATRAPLPSLAPAASWPLLGNVSVIEYDRLVAERRFTRAGDSFVIDHSLGRRFPEQLIERFPLPVLSFTAALEIVAEAAQKMSGVPVTVISNVRASRWLALDGGNLTVRAEAERRGPAIQIALFDSSGDALGPAFAASAPLAARAGGPPIFLASDAAACPPARWTAEAFYRRYAFHGPSFQGIRQVTALGPRSIEAELEVTALPGLQTEALQLDPALLDCAGQLVAFWLLEHEKREPSFGIFPFAARRVTLHHRPLPLGQRVRCRGAITLHSAAKTDASFVFIASDGRVVATIEGLEQRLIEFPHPLARWIFGGEAAEFSQPATATPERVAQRIAMRDWTLLAESWGIWQRALAHLVLGEEELAVWLNLPRSYDLRLQWLLERIVAKEAVRRWADRHCAVAPDVADIVIGEGPKVICKTAGLRQPHLDLKHEDGIIVAAVW